MKITFSMIVFNAASTLPRGMLEACIKNVYPYAHEIIIAEGGTKAANGHYWDGFTNWATADGRSTDNTLASLYSIDDPHKKITIIESKGFWPGKTAMCNAIAEKATGDYLWQLDSDEFYKHEDKDKIVQLLIKDRPDAVHFYANHFWGDWNNVIDETNGKAWGNDVPWTRLYRHFQGSKWKSHEPPEYLFPNGKPCNSGKVVTRDQTLQMGIKMYHYSCVNDRQAHFKMRLYNDHSYLSMYNQWKQNKATKLKGGSITKSFLGEHPQIIKELINGRSVVPTRA